MVASVRVDCAAFARAGNGSSRKVLLCAPFRVLGSGICPNYRTSDRKRARQSRAQNLPSALCGGARKWCNVQSWAVDGFPCRSSANQGSGATASNRRNHDASIKDRSTLQRARGNRSIVRLSRSTPLNVCTCSSGLATLGSIHPGSERTSIPELWPSHPCSLFLAPPVVGTDWRWGDRDRKAVPPDHRSHRSGPHPRRPAAFAFRDSPARRESFATAVRLVGS
jgi:hypothetical protein